jgi:hypothetical protein
MLRALLVEKRELMKLQGSTRGGMGKESVTTESHKNR